MTIDQAISKLALEQQNQIEARFHCRAIMVNNISQYSKLLSRLRNIPGLVTVSPAVLFTSDDVLPQYERLTDAEYHDQWVVLPGVSEYLRLFGKKEAESQRFAKLWNYLFPATSRGRIIIPLWGCEAQWHDRALHLCEDERKAEAYYDCTDANADEQHMTLTVLSKEFLPHISQMVPADSHVSMCLREWYAYWANPDAEIKTFVLMTGRYKSIQPAEGDISIRVIDDTMSFIREMIDGGHALTKENCPEAAAAQLFNYALQGASLQQAITSALNVQVFSGLEIMNKWDRLNQGQKQLVRLWYNLFPDESYLCHCMLNATGETDLRKHILLDVFALMRDHPDWIQESREIVRGMAITKDTEFFKYLDGIPEFSDRLPFLTGKSKDERIYLLHMTGLWMRQSPEDVVKNKTIQSIYPQLIAYLDEKAPGADLDIQNYLSRYKAYKLSNTLPEDEDLYFMGISIDPRDIRYARLSNYIDDDCVVLWVDALGAEWFSLLYWGLNNKRDLKIVDSCIVQATLPTETCFNNQWEQMSVPHVKKDKLDKLAHKGVVDEPDYYACVEEQIDFVSKTLIESIESLLKKYHRVVITGDHGTSRLAARFFHKREGMPVPNGARVCSHGRYCEATDACVIIDPNVRDFKSVRGERYLVYSNYDHFKMSGFAAGAEDDNAVYGEIHGGASPEEALVPVFVVDSKKEKTITAQWDKETVKISRKAAKPVVVFNKPVHRLQIKINGIAGVCTPSADKKRWNVTFDGLKDGVFEASLVADGILISIPKLTVKPALGDDDIFG